MPACILKSLPPSRAAAGVLAATARNPLNAPSEHLEVLPAARLAVLTSRYWGPRPRRLSVSFMERPSTAFRTKVLSHMNAWWTGGAGVRFVYTAGTGAVRITTVQEGYWSYLGTDIHLISPSEPTLCLQEFTASTPDAEYARVVRHETGHTLGFPHEHMRKEVINRIDRERAYAYFARYQGWSRRDVDQQVLTPLEDRQIMATALPQETSVMCYQLPGSIMKDRRPVPGGSDITAEDRAFANKLYPR